LKEISTKATSTKATPRNEPIKELPAFVYGTLRNGFGNYYGCLEGKTDKEVIATLVADIHLLRGGNIPGIKKGDGVVVGELMYINPKVYQFVMEDLDSLEGNGFFYNREEVTVTTKEGEKVQAWTYFYCTPNRLGVLIPDGDYKRLIIESRKKR
jgi:gamma-glutamylcyclotransferase (GGCT)/AIG2-like uncharacterized protein YtfP